jgi:hypothetical protein
MSQGRCYTCLYSEQVFWHQNPAPSGIEPQNPTRFQVLMGFCFRHDMAMTEGKLHKPEDGSGDSGLRLLQSTTS